MKEGWKMVKLGEVCEFKTGNSTPAARITTNENLYPCYGGNGIRGYIDEFLFDGNYPIIGRVGALCGNVHISNGRFYATEHAIAVLPKVDINYHWLAKALEALELRKFASGFAQPVLSVGTLKKLSLPLPPLSEQTRIVSLLDDAFGKLERSREKALKLLDDAKEIFQAQLKKEMTFKEGWEVKKFSELFKLKSGDALSGKNIIKGDYPVIGGNGVTGYHNSYNKDGNHVIIGRVGALCGNVHRITGKFWLTDNAFEVIYDHNKFSNSYLISMLRYCNLNKYARQAAQPVISNSSLKDVLINIPPIKEQCKISVRIRLLIIKLKQIEEKTNKYLADLDELKQSLLKKAFEGKL